MVTTIFLFNKKTFIEDYKKFFMPNNQVGLLWNLWWSATKKNSVILHFCGLQKKNNAIEFWKL